jgi:uncharacterized protein YrzB (UPF0473 family)
MEKENFKFIFENEEGKKINCEMILSFYLRDKDRNYMLFTDNTYDEDHNLKVYPYYNTSKNEEMIPVTEPSEFDMIDKVYQSVVKKVS